MSSTRCASAVLLPFAAFSAGCRQAPQPRAAPQEPARAMIASPSVLARTSLPQGESPPPHTQKVTQTPTRSFGEPELQDLEERKGPFTFGGQTFTVVTHSKRLAGKRGDFAQALASLDIADASGAAVHHEEFPHA